MPKTRKGNVMTYNGWKNWETWNVALWCDNEYEVYRERKQRKPRTAEDVETFVRDMFPDGTPDMRVDPYKIDAVDVDWQEIADHWADE
jgi:hypothetical protein